MKKVIFAFTAGLMFLLGATGVNAQNSKADENLKDSRYSFTISKVNDTPEKSNRGLTIINSKAVKDFKKAYKNVSGENWMQTEEGYGVRFAQDGKSVIVYYDKNGNWSGSLKGYTEDKMPFEVRDMVKRSYYDFSITYVDEVETTKSENGPVYIVHIEDKSTIKFVRVSNGEMTVWKAFEKQQ